MFQGFVDFLIAIFGLIVGAGGGVLFYSQRKKTMIIDNESKLAAEWEKLYREQKSIADTNSGKIADLSEKVYKLEARIDNDRPYLCFDRNCEKRKHSVTD